MTEIRASLPIPWHTEHLSLNERDHPRDDGARGVRLNTHILASLPFPVALLASEVLAQSNWSQFRGERAQGVAVGDFPLPVGFGVDGPR